MWPGPAGGAGAGGAVVGIGKLVLLGVAVWGGRSADCCECLYLRNCTRATFMFVRMLLQLAMIYAYAHVPASNSWCVRLRVIVLVCVCVCVLACTCELACVCVCVLACMFMCV